MKKQTMAKYIGIHRTTLSHYIRRGIIECYPDNWKDFKSLDNLELKLWVLKAQADIREFHSREIIRYTGQHTNWALPLIYQKYEKELRRY